MAMCYPPTTDWSCAGPEFPEAIDVDLRARAEAFAWSALNALTAMQVAVCPVSVRPCRTEEQPPLYLEFPVSGSGIFRPGINNQGYWVNGCGCGASCGCGAMSEIILPGPVGDVVKVTIGDVTLAPTSYRVDDGNVLVRLDGEQWPSTQDMTAKPGTGDAFVVTYFRGEAPNAMTNFAAGKLAFEFTKLCQGKKCALPKGVTNIVREGVTMEVRQGMFPDGFTGIEEVDTLIEILNPYRLRQQTMIVSPDTMRRGRTTTRSW